MRTRILGSTWQGRILRLGVLSLAYVLAFFIQRQLLTPQNDSQIAVIVRGAFAPLTALAGWAGFGHDSADDRNLIQVKVMQAKAEDVVPKVESVGTIDYFQKIEINAKTAGRIEQFAVKEGDIVHKGQVLVQLEKTFLELERTQQLAAVEAAKSELKLAEEKYEIARQGIESRQIAIQKQQTLLKRLQAEMEKARETFKGKEILFGEGGISQEEFSAVRTELVGREAAYRMAKNDLESSQIGFRDSDIQGRGLKVPEDPAAKAGVFTDLNTRVDLAQVEVARSRVRSAEAQLESTTALLREATIGSPVTGMVAQRNKSVGEQVNAGSGVSAAQAIMVIVDINPVYATTYVKESDLKGIKKGMAFEFLADVFPKEKFEGKVEIINPVIDPKTHTVEVKGILKNNDYRLRPGMFIRAGIVTGKAQSVVLLPTSAIIPQQDSNAFAFVVRGDSAYKVSIVTGKQHGEDRIEILKGIKPDDLVVIDSLSQLRDGMRVRPVIPN